MKKKFLVLIVFWSLSFHISALILEAPHLDPFEKIVNSSDQETLVLFDVDETLLVAKDRILRPCAREFFKKRVGEILENSENVPQGKFNEDYLLGHILARIEYEVVDSKILFIIESLQRKNIKAIAFTRMNTGPCGIIPSLEEWRIEHLKKHSIDFSQAFPQFPELIIEDLESSGRSALFKSGVLCANKQNKGPVLAAFLDQIGFKPSRVIFIDNRMDYLESVEESLRNKEIDFVGFHYTDVEDRLCLINEKLADYQIEHLIKTDIWLSEKEALEILETQDE
jgi:hypothetical protein